MVMLRDASLCDCQTCKGGSVPRKGPLGEPVYGGWKCTCQCHNGAVHFRINTKYGYAIITGTACRNGNYTTSTRNPAKVTCKTCRRTRAFKEAHKELLAQLKRAADSVRDKLSKGKGGDA